MAGFSSSSALLSDRNSYRGHARFACEHHHRMVAAATALVGFRTYPHVDMFETGVRAARSLTYYTAHGTAPDMSCARYRCWCRPKTHKQPTDPLRALMEECSLETRPEYLSASLFMVQPWLDVEELGCTVVVVTAGAPLQAQREADVLALAYGNAGIPSR